LWRRRESFKYAVLVKSIEGAAGTTLANTKLTCEGCGVQHGMGRQQVRYAASDRVGAHVGQAERPESTQLTDVADEIAGGLACAR
jgi:hypothetical protein